jgi:hypothetical protein
MAAISGDVQRLLTIFSTDIAIRTCSQEHKTQDHIRGPLHEITMTNTIWFGAMV